MLKSEDEKVVRLRSILGRLVQKHLDIVGQLELLQAHASSVVRYLEARRLEFGDEFDPEALIRVTP